MMRMGKKRCRAWLEEAFGMPWTEIEREWRRREPIETTGTPVPGELTLDTVNSEHSAGVSAPAAATRKARPRAVKGM